MATSPPVTQIVTQIGPIANILASNDLSKGTMFGATINKLWAIQIYIENQTCKFRYDYEGIADGNLPSATLIKNSNYFYSIICGKYGQMALALLNSGSIVPTPDQPTQLYGYPRTSQYIAISNGETTLELRDVNSDLLPPGAIITWVSKSTSPLPLQSIQYRYAEPNLILLDGISMGIDEILSFQYVVPI